MPDSRSLPARHLPRLCFGTVQLGMPYGAANRTGLPSEAEAQALIREALERGVTLFDTAQAYGEAEMRLGGMHATIAAHGAEVITKLAPLVLDEGEAISGLEARVEAHIHASRRRLQLEVLPYVLLHRVAHLTEYGGCIWRRLLALQAQGFIGRLGVSVATPAEVVEAISMPEVTCVQVPFHILDGRMARTGALTALAKRPDVLVFVRSVFLQGVLAQPAEQWPMLPAAKASQMAALLDGWVKEFGRESRADLCLAYTRAQGWVDVIVLGMETQAQLRQNVALFETAPLDRYACEAIAARVPDLPEDFLNPALWRKGE
ncbi:MAG: aldo/keto reductase [Rickettsiales bacterium]|nr:aldo/keto reductase [Rickettsiales bacterium]